MICVLVCEFYPKSKDQGVNIAMSVRKRDARYRQCVASEKKVLSGGGGAAQSSCAQVTFRMCANTGRARFIRRHSSGHFSFELSGNTN